MVELMLSTDKHAADADDGGDDIGSLVCVNIGEHVDPGVDRAEVEMALVLNHHTQQSLYLVFKKEMKNSNFFFKNERFFLFF